MAERLQDIINRLDAASGMHYKKLWNGTTTDPLSDVQHYLTYAIAKSEVYMTNFTMEADDLAEHQRELDKLMEVHESPDPLAAFVEWTIAGLPREPGRVDEVSSTFKDTEARLRSYLG